jgi:hypothetical protein
MRICLNALLHACLSRLCVYFWIDYANNNNQRQQTESEPPCMMHWNFKTKNEIRAQSWHTTSSLKQEPEINVHINNITLKLRYNNINTNFITATWRTTMKTNFKEVSNRLKDSDPKPGDKLITTWCLCAMFLKLSTSTWKSKCLPNHVQT